MSTVPFRSKMSASSVLRRLTGVGEHAPLSAMIEIADRCNEVCVHCYQIQGQKGEISTDDWRAVLDELAEMGVLFLTISGGECTLRPDFLDIVAHARERKFAVKVFTNGLTMDERLADELARLAVQEVQISLYSPRAEVHDWVTRVPGSFDKVIRAVELLVERRIGVVVKSVLTSFNIEDREAYRDLAARIGADYMLDGTLDPREDGDRGPQSFSISREQWLAIHRDPTLGKKPEKAVERPLTRSVCGACSGGVHVEPNGELRPCTQLSVSLGNALDQGVRRPWAEGGVAAAIRELTWADIHGCRDCDLRSRCTHCFANARKEQGDALGPYRSACEGARRRYELIHDVEPAVLRTEGRDGSIGPYRLLPDHRLEPIDDRTGPSDDALAARLGWVRGPSTQEPVRASPGGLVQIRRPGGREPKVEAVPGLASRPPNGREDPDVAVDSRGGVRQTASGPVW